MLNNNKQQRKQDAECRVTSISDRVLEAPDTRQRSSTLFFHGQPTKTESVCFSPRRQRSPESTNVPRVSPSALRFFFSRRAAVGVRLAAPFSMTETVGGVGGMASSGLGIIFDSMLLRAPRDRPACEEEDGGGDPGAGVLVALVSRGHTPGIENPENRQS